MSSTAMSSTVILYTTLGCHLCEQAKSLLWPLLSERGCQLEEVDIADSEALMAAYGTSIPVVENPLSGERLYWPFDGAQLERLLP